MQQENRTLATIEHRHHRRRRASMSAAAAAAAGGDDDGSSSSRWPKLLLDSGATNHMVGDPRLLSNLRNAPGEKVVKVANGSTLSITEIGDIQMVTAGFTIPDVYLAPGLKLDVISVRELTRSRICTWFDGDRATLYAGSKLVGVAVAPRENNGLYVLESLSVPTTIIVPAEDDEAPAATTSFPPSRSNQISSNKKGKYGDSNSGPSERSRSGSNQLEPFPIEIKAKIIVKAKKKVKAKADNKETARRGAKNDIVPFDSPAMATRSKIAALASPAMATRSKRRLSL